MFKLIPAKPATQSNHAAGATYSTALARVPQLPRHAAAPSAPPRPVFGRRVAK